MSPPPYAARGETSSVFVYKNVDPSSWLLYLYHVLEVDNRQMGTAPDGQIEVPMPNSEKVC